jgi:hypothetical protein
MTEAEWESISRKIRDEGPKGGVARPFLDEDNDRFLDGFNAAASSVGLSRVVVSIPEDFCTALCTLTAFAVYSPEADSFEWDFSALIRRYKPGTPYAAYRRYAHGEYTRLFIGAGQAPGETRPPLLKKAGNAVLFEKWGSRTDWKQQEQWDLWDLVEDALQVCSKNNIYTPGTLEEVLEDVKYQRKRRRRYARGFNVKKQKGGQRNTVRLEEDEPPPFDHNDEVNIKNAVENILPFLPPEKRADLKQDGLSAQVITLRKAISNQAVRDRLDNRRLETIRKLYRKILITRPEELDAPIAGQDGEENENNEALEAGWKASRYETPEQKLLMAEDQEILVGLFRDQFKGSDVFLNRIAQTIREDSERIIEELVRYNGKRHNTGSGLFAIFREANGYVPDDPVVGKIHTAFTVKIRAVIERFLQEEALP